jgi:pSer/pThr/pTyr-binding forkhead associated (FHA) protein
MKDTVVVGRSPDCDLSVRLPSISRQHARILFVQGRWHIEDMNSRLGTYVNGRMIESRTVLQQSDRIRICDFEIDFLETGIPTSSSQAPDSGMMLEEEDSGTVESEHELVYVTGRKMSSRLDVIVEILEKNHLCFSLPREESERLERDILDSQSDLSKALRESFHRVVIFDAKAGLDHDSHFDGRVWAQYMLEQFARAFGLEWAKGAYFAEDIPQILKDEPRSLLCILHCEVLPEYNHYRLRGFTQELHRLVLIITE